MVATEAMPKSSIRLASNRAEAEPGPLRWTTEQFYRMGDSGCFEGLHVELIEGEIVGMMTLGSRHVTGVLLATDALREIFGEGYVVRSQAPLNIDDYTDPEPDVAVVSGTIRSYAQAHPSTALLIVEVSDTTLRYDKGKKASLYARAGIQDYWILNLIDNQLEVYRQPVVMPDQLYGYGYAEIANFQSGANIAPLAALQAMVKVADLLP